MNARGHLQASMPADDTLPMRGAVIYETIP